mgnify:CR=1 FL=1
MSVEASQDGGFQLADVLAEAASQYLDQAELMEGQRSEEGRGEGEGVHRGAYVVDVPRQCELVAPEAPTDRRLGFGPTQTRVDQRGMSWQRFEQGRIVEGWDTWNVGGLMERLGAAARISW